MPRGKTRFCHAFGAQLTHTLKAPIIRISQKTASEDPDFVSKLIKKKEDLHPDLLTYFDGEMVRHPLIFSSMISPGRFGLINYEYEQAKNAARDSRTDGKWFQFIFLHERPYQLSAFGKIAEKLSDREYWDLLGDVVNQSENLRQSPKLLRKLLTANRPSREFMMNDLERSYFSKLPDNIQIYRGFDRENSKGWSWTLDIAKAKWFARRFEMLGGFPKVASGFGRKKDVIAYFSRRRESTILVAPENVKDIRIRRLV